jgi:hypothetical protein
MKFMLKTAKKRESRGCGKRTAVVKEDPVLRVET